MRVCWLPLYDERGASSRLRVFALHEQLLRMGHDSVIGWDEHADVAVVQKHQDAGKLERLARHKGIRIYDVDDLQDVWQVTCDVITTDTAKHAEWAEKDCSANVGPVEVIPDCIDFCPPAPYGPTQGTSVVWFGHPANLTQQVVTRLHQLSDHGVPTVTLLWSMETFVRDLRQAGVAYLSHAGQDQGKSNNKAIAAITHGLPVVGEASEAYRELLEGAGVGWAYAHDQAEALAACDVLLRDDGERKRYLDKVQPYVWDRFHPAVIAQQWVKTVEALIANRVA